MLPQQTTPRRRTSRVTLFVTVLLVCLLAVAWVQREAIYDWARLYNYQAPPAIAQLATDATMTDSARRMYYVNHPGLKDKSTFGDYCDSPTEQSVVLGCYKGGQRGIYLLDVSNAELAGIKQVTAAHEMLHAAYDRLSPSERTRIDRLLQDYYNNQLQDQTIKDTVDGYRKSEPDDLVNEMHSIFGTQVANLPTELEDYYKQYFSDRAKLVSYYNAYDKAFSGRQAKIKEYDNQLQAWKGQIDSLEKDLTSQESSLNAQRSALNAQRSRGDYEAYNSGVDSYNAAVVAFNADLAQLKRLVNSYNDMINQRNAIAFEEQQLMESLNTSKFQQQ